MSLRSLRSSMVRGACVGVSLFAVMESRACINDVKGFPLPPEDFARSPVELKMRELTSILAAKDDLLAVRKFGEPPRRDFAQDARRYAAALAYIREFEARGGQPASFAETINYSVALIHVDRAEQAVKALMALEAKQPGAYETATNLGTAYELVGKLEDAAVWISKGIERNPASHGGTEWLHLAILRAKIKLRDDPAWLQAHGVLEGEGHRVPAEIVSAIEIQLRERLQFVKPRDAAVCDLFYQAALRLEDDRARDRRAHYLRESLRFGDWRKADVEKQLKS